jgi:hypothetical protein
MEIQPLSEANNKQSKQSLDLTRINANREKEVNKGKEIIKGENATNKEEKEKIKRKVSFTVVNSKYEESGNSDAEGELGRYHSKQDSSIGSSRRSSRSGFWLFPSFRRDSSDFGSSSTLDTHNIKKTPSMGDFLSNESSFSGSSKGSKTLKQELWAIVSKKSTQDTTNIAKEIDQLEKDAERQVQSLESIRRLFEKIPPFRDEITSLRESQDLIFADENPEQVLQRIQESIFSLKGKFDDLDNNIKVQTKMAQKLIGEVSADGIETEYEETLKKLDDLKQDKDELDGLVNKKQNNRGLLVFNNKKHDYMMERIQDLSHSLEGKLNDFRDRFQRLTSTPENNKRQQIYGLITNLEQDFSEIRKQIEGLEKNQQKMKEKRYLQKINDLSGQIKDKDKEEEINDLSGQIKDKEKEMHSLDQNEQKARIEAFLEKREKQALQKQIDQLNQKLKLVENQRDHLHENVQKLHQQLEQSAQINLQRRYLDVLDSYREIISDNQISWENTIQPSIQEIGESSRSAEYEKRVNDEEIIQLDKECKQVSKAAKRMLIKYVLDQKASEEKNNIQVEFKKKAPSPKDMVLAFEKEIKACERLAEACKEGATEQWIARSKDKLGLAFADIEGFSGHLLEKYKQNKVSHEDMLSALRLQIEAYMMWAEAHKKVANEENVHIVRQDAKRTYEKVNEVLDVLLERYKQNKVSHRDMLSALQIQSEYRIYTEVHEGATKQEEIMRIKQYTKKMCETVKEVTKHSIEEHKQNKISNEEILSSLELQVDAYLIYTKAHEGATEQEEIMQVKQYNEETYENIEKVSDTLLEGYKQNKVSYKDMVVTLRVETKAYELLIEAHKEGATDQERERIKEKVEKIHKKTKEFSDATQKIRHENNNACQNRLMALANEALVCMKRIEVCKEDANEEDIQHFQDDVNRLYSEMHKFTIESRDVSLKKNSLKNLADYSMVLRSMVDADKEWNKYTEENQDGQTIEKHKKRANTVYKAIKRNLSDFRTYPIEAAISSFRVNFLKGIKACKEWIEIIKQNESETEVSKYEMSAFQLYYAPLIQMRIGSQKAKKANNPLKIGERLECDKYIIEASKEWNSIKDIIKGKEDIYAQFKNESLNDIYLEIRHLSDEMQSDNQEGRKEFTYDNQLKALELAAEAYELWAENHMEEKGDLWTNWNKRFTGTANEICKHAISILDSILSEETLDINYFKRATINAIKVYNVCFDWNSRRFNQEQIEEQFKEVDKKFSESKTKALGKIVETCNSGEIGQCEELEKLIFDEFGKMRSVPWESQSN